jgi:hypothetical protein
MEAHNGRGNVQIGRWGCLAGLIAPCKKDWLQWPNCTVQKGLDEGYWVSWLVEGGRVDEAGSLNRGKTNEGEEGVVVKKKNFITNYSPPFPSFTQPRL